jgi:hypothetical protein
MAFVPVQPPDAVQLVALVELHVNVDEPPDAMLVGDAVNVTVGAPAIATAAVCDAEPPVPEQLSVYVPLVVRALVLCVPDVALVPLQLPDAVQLVAFVELHVNVDDPPDAMLVGDAVSVTVGAAAIVTVAVCDAEPPVPEQLSV